MLRIFVHNDQTGSEDSSNYDWVVAVNARTIAKGRILGHKRSDGWEALLKRVVEREGQTFSEE